MILPTNFLGFITKINSIVKINEIISETTAGAVATVAVPLGGMRKRPNPSIFGKTKKTKKKVKEGEERMIISQAAVEKLVDMFLDSEDEFENRDALENAIYNALTDLDVEDVVDPDMVHGGQRMGDFASGRIIDVVDSSSIIDDVMGYLNVREGKSPHKKGTKKYKAHMAAMHAG